MRSISTSAMPPSSGIRDHDRGLRADGVRQQLAVRGRAAEHHDDQRLLRADAAGRDREQRRERSDDHHEQRVAQRARDAERLEEGRGGADAAAPADQLGHGDQQDVPARGVRRIVKPWRTRAANALPAMWSRRAVMMPASRIITSR